MRKTETNTHFEIFPSIQLKLEIRQNNSMLLISKSKSKQDLRLQYANLII